MAECGWEVYINEKGDYDAIIFINEKASNDIVILNAIAPYVEPNSYIQMQELYNITYELSIRV